MLLEPLSSVLSRRTPVCGLWGCCVLQSTQTTARLAPEADHPNWNTKYRSITEGSSVFYLFAKVRWSTVTQRRVYILQSWFVRWTDKRCHPTHPVDTVYPSGVVAIKRLLIRSSCSITGLTPSQNSLITMILKTLPDITWNQPQILRLCHKRTKVNLLSY